VEIISAFSLSAINQPSTQSTSDPEANALNAEGLPDMLTAKDLEAVLQIDRKTIYAYVQRGPIPYVRIESNVRFSQAPGHALAGGAQLPAPPGSRKGCQAPMTNFEGTRAPGVGIGAFPFLLTSTPAGTRIRPDCLCH